MNVTGTVSAFDKTRGIGEITADNATYAFHSTQLADGTRSIALGTIVEFAVAPGLPGRWEAVRVTPKS